ncbi:hypothetical protein J4444_03910 [Candidatus Woesearchaeota archaeon]|nr:hypothetical protein [Candidatus Woesearchaeota archaeon]
MEKEQNFDGFTTVLKFALRRVIQYLSYFCLTATVITTFFVIMVTLLTIFGDSLSFGFIQYLSFLNPAYAENTVELHLTDFLKIYAFISLVLFLLTEFLFWFIKYKFHKEFNFSYKKKVLVFTVILTLIYSLAFLIVPLVKMSEGQTSKEAYYIFGGFYFISIISLQIHLWLDYLASKLLPQNDTKLRKIPH